MLKVQDISLTRRVLGIGFLVLCVFVYVWSGVIAIVVVMSDDSVQAGVVLLSLVGIGLVAVVAFALLPFRQRRSRVQRGLPILPVFVGCTIGVISNLVAAGMGVVVSSL